MSGHTLRLPSASVGAEAAGYSPLQLPCGVPCSAALVDLRPVSRPVGGLVGDSLFPVVDIVSASVGAGLFGMGSRPCTRVGARLLAVGSASGTRVGARLLAVGVVTGAVISAYEIEDLFGQRPDSICLQDDVTSALQRANAVGRRRPAHWLRSASRAVTGRASISLRRISRPWRAVVVCWNLLHALSTVDASPSRVRSATSPRSIVPASALSISLRLRNVLSSSCALIFSSVGVPHGNPLPTICGAGPFRTAAGSTRNEFATS